jgi:redox-sensitive bicupin YhaK (pirin superfamily)
MITIRRAGERLRTRIDWLESRHAFSFEAHIDPRHMGFRALRALNEHRVEAGRGFTTHSRREMEIVTYVLAGVLRHEDSLGAAGHGTLTPPRDVDHARAFAPHELQADRHAWVQVVHGAVRLNGIALSAGDGAAIVDEPVVLTASSTSEALLIDLE